MSADSTSTERPAGAEDGADEVVESVDQSLLAIMKEVQQADEPAAPEAQATAAQTVDPDNVTPTEAGAAEVEPSDAARTTLPETPDAVVQTAETAAWATEPSAEPGPHAAEPPAASDALQAASASDDEPAEGADDGAVELSDAGVELSIEELEAEAVVESILATARTSHHDAEQSLGAAPAFEEDPPPSDEVLLANIVLPAAFSAAQSMPAASESARHYSVTDLGDDDRTTISPLPPEIDPAPARLPAPSLTAAPDKVRRVTPTWPGTETVNPAGQQFGRLPRPPVRGWVRMARQVASHRVNASVAQLAIVVVSATVFGAAAVRLSVPTPPASATAATTMIPEPRPDELHYRALPPRPPEIAPLPPAVVEVAEQAPPVEVEQPKPRPARKRVIRVQAPATDVTAERGAEASVADPTSQAAVPARRTASAKPRARHVAQQGGAWVDPFGD